MKRILLIGGMALLCHVAFAQSSNPAGLVKAADRPAKTTANTTVVPTKTLEQKMAATPQGQLNMRLGLPSTATPQEYASAKEKLYTENRTKYNELFSPKAGSSQSSTSVRNVSRKTFNEMPEDRKAYISAHPELYKIVD